MTETPAEPRTERDRIRNLVDQFAAGLHTAGEMPDLILGTLDSARETPAEPQALSAAEEAELRRRLAISNGPDDDVGNAVFGGPEDAEEMAARLLATLDAERAANPRHVEALREAARRFEGAFADLLNDNTTEAWQRAQDHAATLRAALAAARLPAEGETT